MEYSGSGDFITVDSTASESESDLFFTVPLVSETATTEVDKTVDKTVTKAKMSDVVTDTNVTCDESGFCSDPMPTDISLEDFFGFDTMTKIQNTGMNSIFFHANICCFIPFSVANNFICLYSWTRIRYVYKISGKYPRWIVDSVSIYLRIF